MCWPAYAGLVSALGLGFLISTKYLLPLTVAFLAVTAMALGFRASRRNGYGPLWLGLVAAAVVLSGKFYFDVPQTTYAGVGLLIAASVWNSWPRRAATTPSCPGCVPGAGFNQRNAQGDKHMKHKIEIFSAGCKTCKDAIEAVRKLAGSEHEVVVHDMHQQEIASRATQHGVRSLPAVVIDGKLAGCCSGRGVEDHVLRETLR
jgi:glutaredoxin